MTEITEIGLRMAATAVHIQELNSRNMKKELPLLEIQNISGKIFRDISFNLYPGEILGIIGVMGSGRTELLETIFGILRKDSGQIKIDGKNVTVNEAKPLESRPRRSDFNRGDRGFGRNRRDRW